MRGDDYVHALAAHVDKKGICAVFRQNNCDGFLPFPAAAVRHAADCLDSFMWTQMLMLIDAANLGSCCHGILGFKVSMRSTLTNKWCTVYGLTASSETTGNSVAAALSIWPWQASAQGAKQHPNPV